MKLLVINNKRDNKGRERERKRGIFFIESELLIGSTFHWEQLREEFDIMDNRERDI